MTRLRKPRLFVQVAETSAWYDLRYMDERGEWWGCNPEYEGPDFDVSAGWSSAAELDDDDTDDLLLTHVEVPL